MGALIHGPLPFMGGARGGRVAVLRLGQSSLTDMPSPNPSRKREGGI